MSTRSEAATLPHEMLQRIMCILCHDLRAVLLVPRVSKHWSAAADSGSFWLKMIETRWQIQNSSEACFSSGAAGGQGQKMQTDNALCGAHGHGDLDKDLWKRKFVNRATGVSLEAAAVVRLY